MRDDSRSQLWLTQAIYGLGNEVDAAIHRAAETKYEGDQVLIEAALEPWLKSQSGNGSHRGSNAMLGWTNAPCSPGEINQHTGNALSFEDLDDRGKAASILFERVRALKYFCNNSIPNTRQVDKVLFGKDNESLIKMIRELGGISSEDSPNG